MIQISSVTVASFVEDVYLAQRVVGEGQAGHLRDTARMLGRYLNREALIADLTTEIINGFLRSLEKTRAPSTLVSRRGHLLGIVRCAVDAGLIDEPPPRQIRRYKKSAVRPEAWTTEEVQRLVDAARTLRGSHNGTSRAAWWEAYIRTAYDTGLRPVDLLRLTQPDIDPHGVLAIEQHKTGVLVVRMVRPETLRAIRCLPATEPIFGGWLGRDQRGVWFSRIVAAAGLDGTFYRLRSTCGTLVEAARPGMGHLALGNGRTVFERHYLCRRVAVADVPMPPALH